MEIKITKEKAEFNKSPYGNKLRMVVVQFPNCISETTGKSFKWLPTYKQMRKILDNLEEIEIEKSAIIGKTPPAKPLDLIDVKERSE